MTFLLTKDKLNPIAFGAGPIVGTSFQVCVAENENKEKYCFCDFKLSLLNITLLFLLSLFNDANVQTRFTCWQAIRSWQTLFSGRIVLSTHHPNTIIVKPVINNLHL